MVHRRDYDALAEAGGIPKPAGKRKSGTGRETFGSTLQTYARLSPVGKNAERREEKFGEQCEACRMLPCVFCGAPAPSDPCHSPRVSQGGIDSDAVPGCRSCHDQMDSMPHSRWWRKVGLNPQDVKDAVRSWMDAGYPRGAVPFEGRR